MIGNTNFKNKLQQANSDVITEKTLANYVGKSYVIEAYLSSDKLSWYRRYSNGWIEQGGPITTSSQTVNFILPFSVNPLSMTVTNIANTVGSMNQYSSRIRSYSKTTMVTYVDGNMGIWEAKGY